MKEYKLKHLRFDRSGRLQVQRSIDGVPDGYWAAITAFNLNTRTLQVGGIKFTYPAYVKWVGEDAAKETIDYLVMSLYEFGDR
ncbi:hypothetical protein AVT44_gp34 [Acinetobacter phage Fri1]|uniref:Uncharacterized protein n=1 Tax=Acinetobacter phage Fri1 TaxID=1647373 RepID=A0A0H4TFB7_9CAUD|nr:hypothetical protein AVT44_gp34 [Acinetobacter phage Fri1]AKQ06838.1 hypothetical protein Fri1_34 [Acinetobacter phage Fri1]